MSSKGTGVPRKFRVKVNTQNEVNKILIGGVALWLLLSALLLLLFV